MHRGFDTEVAFVHVTVPQMTREAGKLHPWYDSMRSSSLGLYEDVQCPQKVGIKILKKNYLIQRGIISCVIP